jgi:chemotaxis protein CheX
MSPSDAVTLDSNFIRPFVDAALRTLEIQCQLPATAGAPFTKGLKPMDPTDIAAVIALNSPHFFGSAALCFPQSFYLLLMSRMLGETYTEMTDEIHDGASELLNMTFGHAKVILNEQGYALEKAIPTIIAGANLSVRHMARSPTVVIPFECESGRFHIEIAASPTADSEAGSG